MLHCSSYTLYFQLPNWLSKEWGSYHEAYNTFAAKINDESISNCQRFSASLSYAKVQLAKLLAVLSVYCTLVTPYMLTFFTQDLYYIRPAFSSTTHVVEFAQGNG